MELTSTNLQGKMVSSSLALVFLFLSLVLFFPLTTTGLPLCTDSRAPLPVKLPLSFCSYNVTACCNTTEDSDLQKLFLSMNITDAACGSVVKSLLCKISMVESPTSPTRTPRRPTLVESVGCNSSPYVADASNGHNFSPYVLRTNDASCSNGNSSSQRKLVDFWDQKLSHIRQLFRIVL